MLSGGSLWVAVTVGGVAVGEATALLLGTTFGRGGRSPWATAKNDAFLAADILTGGALIALPFASGPAVPAALWAVVAVFAATHAYRVAECLRRTPGAFCANSSLLAVDVGKLAGVLFLGVLLALRQV